MGKGKNAGIFCLITGIVLCIMAVCQYSPYYENKKEILRLQNYVQKDIEDQGLSVDVSTPENAGEDQEDWGENLPMLDFDRLNQVNEDICGWIYVPGTVVNYPVLYGDEYLSKDYQGQYSPLGAIFTCNETDFDDQWHVLLYGHRTFDGQMFGILNSFDALDFAKDYSVYFYTAEGEIYEFIPAASYLCSPSGSSFEDVTEIGEYVQIIKNEADDHGWADMQMLETGEKILTLVTCPPKNSDSLRRIVQCVGK